MFHQGILARVVIPEQSLGSGRVQLRVIEAKIVSVRFHGDIGPIQGKVEAYLNHLRGLAPFDLDTAQHYLLLANDIPGVQVSAKLKHSTATDNPASQDPGALDLDVTIERRPFDVVGEIQNTGSDTQGPWSAIARVDLEQLHAARRAPRA